MKVKIKPLSFKMRNKVNMHGSWWHLIDDTATQIHISTLNKVHNQNRYAYEVWVTPGKDVEILETKHE